MTSTRRVIPLALAALVTATAAVALLVSGKTEAAATPAHEHGTVAAHRGQAGISARELALRSTMDRLWQEHVVWTRLAIISLTTNAPDTNATVARLLSNQTDIGNAVKPFYGAAAGKQLTALLREHILIAADLIAVAQKGDGAVERLHGVANVCLVPKQSGDGRFRVGGVRGQADDRQPRPGHVLLPEAVHRPAERKLVRRDRAGMLRHGHDAVVMGGLVGRFGSA